MSEDAIEYKSNKRFFEGSNLWKSNLFSCDYISSIFL